MRPRSGWFCAKPRRFRFFRDTAPHATGGVYVNFLTDDESDRVKAAYGPNFHRLEETRRKYDPKNLFRIIQNIRPNP